MKPKFIYVAFVKNDYGIVTYAGHTQRGARLALYAYVREWWYLEQIEQPMPTNKWRAVLAYFEAVENEYCGVEKTELKA